MESNLDRTIEQAKGLAQTLIKRRSNQPTEDGRLLMMGEEYVLVRKAVVDQLDELVGKFAAEVTLYRMGHRMGELEAQSLVGSGQVPEGALLRCLMRPFFYMANGMGTVDVLDLHYDGDPKNFYVLYEDLRPVSPHLVMGYSAGWKSAMLGVELVAKAVQHPGTHLRVLVAPKALSGELLRNPFCAQPREAFKARPLRLS